MMSLKQAAAIWVEKARRAQNREKARRWRAANHEKANACAREGMRRWYAANAEAGRKRALAWRNANLEKARTHERRWRATNTEKKLEIGRVRRARKKLIQAAQNLKPKKNLRKK